MVSIDSVYQGVASLEVETYGTSRAQLFHAFNTSRPNVNNENLPFLLKPDDVRIFPVDPVDAHFLEEVGSDSLMLEVKRRLHAGALTERARKLSAVAYLAGKIGPRYSIFSEDHQRISFLNQLGRVQEWRLAGNLWLKGDYGWRDSMHEPQIGIAKPEVGAPLGFHALHLAVLPKIDVLDPVGYVAIDFDTPDLGVKVQNPKGEIGFVPIRHLVAVF